MFIGALLDGVPESFVLEITLAIGGTINAAFLFAVFVCNIPQSVAGTTSRVAAGSTSRRVSADGRSSPPPQPAGGRGRPGRRQRAARRHLGRSVRRRHRARRLDDARGLPTLRTRRRLITVLAY